MLKYEGQLDLVHSCKITDEPLNQSLTFPLQWRSCLFCLLMCCDNEMMLSTCLECAKCSINQAYYHYDVIQHLGKLHRRFSSDLPTKTVGGQGRQYSADHTDKERDQRDLLGSQYLVQGHILPTCVSLSPQAFGRLFLSYFRISIWVQACGLEVAFHSPHSAEMCLPGLRLLICQVRLAQVTAERFSDPK